MDKFFIEWFKGFEKGLKEMDEESRRKLLSICGRTCADSFPRKIYEDIWNRTKECSAFFSQLSREIPEVSVNEVISGSEYEVSYSKCLCDLHTEGCMTDGCLCECSRQSLIYLLLCIMPETKIEVKLEASILRGGDKCLLRVLLQ